MNTQETISVKKQINKVNDSILEMVIRIRRMDEVLLDLYEENNKIIKSLENEIETILSNEGTIKEVINNVSR
jgi:hypothetical protein